MQLIRFRRILTCGGDNIIRMLAGYSDEDALAKDSHTQPVTAVGVKVF